MASAKKGKKAKGKKSVSLQDFLNTTVQPGMTQIPAKVMNWADECEDDETGPRPLMALPTAPRAARILNDDTIPTQPPFNAFLSNLPYDIKEEDLEEFFDSLEIQTKSVRLPQNSDSSSRVIRGIGYVEYETREDLIEAISLPDPMMRNRRIRIDVSNPNEQKDRDRNQNRNQRYGNNEDRPERPLDTNWRQRTDKSPDRNGGEPPRENRRGYGGGFRDRERVRDASPRQDDGGSWRSARQADPSPPRRQFDREDRNRNRRPFEERGERGGLTRSDRSSADEPARERPKLTLAPRTLPIEELPKPPPDIEREEENDHEDSAEESERPKPTPVPAAKVFGEAKPVDTLAKEQEMEARRLEKVRLQKEKEAEEREKVRLAREKELEEKEAARQLEREQRDKENAEKHASETQEKEEHGEETKSGGEEVVRSTSARIEEPAPKKKEEVNWRKMAEDREKEKEHGSDDNVSSNRRSMSPRHSKRYSPDRRGDHGPKRTIAPERRGGGGGGYNRDDRPHRDADRRGGDRGGDNDLERRNKYNDGQRGRGGDQNNRQRDNNNGEIRRNSKDPPQKREHQDRDKSLEDLPTLQQSSGPNLCDSNPFAGLSEEEEEEA